MIHFCSVDTATVVVASRWYAWRMCLNPPIKPTHIVCSHQRLVRSPRERWACDRTSSGVCALASAIAKARLHNGLDWRPRYNVRCAANPSLAAA